MRLVLLVAAGLLLIPAPDAHAGGHARASSVDADESTGPGSDDPRRRRALRRHAGGPRPEVFTLDGYFRVRGNLFVNLDLDRGLTPSVGLPIFPVPASGGQVLGSFDTRLRLDLGIKIGDAVRAKVRVDALDGLVLGSTPEGLPPTRWSQTAWGSTRQLPPTSGWNSFVDSVRIKEAYGEVQTPIGLLAFGRMEMPSWGLGMVTGGPEDLDDDFDDPVDRLAFATSLADHLVGVSFDINSVGPTSSSSQGTLTSGQPIDLELQDNAYTLSLAVGRLHDDAAIRRRRVAGKVTVSYGAYATWRFQKADFPTYYLGGLDSEDAAWTEGDAVARRMNAVMGDLWLRLHAGPVRLEIEAAYLWSRVDDPSVDPSISLPALTANQYGGVFEAEVEAVPDKLWVEAGVGLASGDPAPGLGVAPPVGQVTSRQGDLDGPQFDLTSDTTINNFRFHPGYRVDLIFWRSVVGAVTDAFYVRPQVRWRLNDAFEGRLSVLVSSAVRPSSTPSGAGFYGAEIDLGVDWTPVAGFVARAEYGLFLPGAALDHPTEGHRAQPAQAFRLTLGVVW